MTVINGKAHVFVVGFLVPDKALLLFFPDFTEISGNYDFLPAVAVDVSRGKVSVADMIVVTAAVRFFILAVQGHQGLLIHSFEVSVFGFVYREL